MPITPRALAARLCVALATLCPVALGGLPRSNAPSATRDGIVAVKEWARNRTAKAVSDYQARYNTATHHASPDQWEDIIMYQMLADRFNNGNASNVSAVTTSSRALPCKRLTGGSTRAPPQDRANTQTVYGTAQMLYQDTHMTASMAKMVHGGDLRGVIDRLDYLLDLGVTGLFFQPLAGHNGEYHGYCQADLGIVDPNFGTDEDLRELVQEAHKRGMWVMLDVVVNHFCGTSAGKTVSDWPGDGTRGSRDQCFLTYNGYDVDGTPVDQSKVGSMVFSDDFWGPLDHQNFYHRCGQFSLLRDQGSDIGKAGRRFGDFAFDPQDESARNGCQVLHVERCYLPPAPGATGRQRAHAKLCWW